jgi:hypothetical protein
MMATTPAMISHKMTNCTAAAAEMAWRTALAAAERLARRERVVARKRHAVLAWLGGYRSVSSALSAAATPPCSEGGK